MELSKGAGVPVNHMLHSQRQPQPEKDTSDFQRKSLSEKDTREAFLIVAALLMTVSFAAGFTVPGGLYSSDDPNPKIRGTAVFAGNSVFWIFIIFNTITMYSSAMACGLLSVGIVNQSKLTRNIHFPHLFLTCAFLAASVAFLSAVALVVASNRLLAGATILIGAFHYILYIFLIK